MTTTEQPESMVERVAKAIRDTLPYDTVIDAEFAARATIEAMRMPTQDQLKAAFLTGHRDPTGVWIFVPGEVYRAMVDAALTQGEGK
jgi:hypothetical protein